MWENKEEIIKTCIDRNMVIIDQESKLGEFSDRLIRLLRENAGFEITDILHFDEFYQIYKNTDCNDYFGREWKAICVAINKPLIDKNGWRPEYVLMGVY